MIYIAALHNKKEALVEVIYRQLEPVTLWLLSSHPLATIFITDLAHWGMFEEFYGYPHAYKVSTIDYNHCTIVA